MEKIVLLCEDTLDGILTAIYEAFALKNQKETDMGTVGRLCKRVIEIYSAMDYEYEMFSTCIEVTTEPDKAEKTVHTIRKRLGEQVYFDIVRALCHFDRNRATKVFDFLVLAFERKVPVMELLGETCAMAVFELARKTGNEAHLFNGFVRFKEIHNILYARIEPKCQVLLLIADHFADRFAGENFVIYDAVHEVALIHRKFEAPFLSYGKQAEEVEQICKGNLLRKQEEEDYEGLWKTYFESISIKERTNPRCQRNLIPLWYRKNMVDFS